MDSANKGGLLDRRAARRAERAMESRRDILDAAERVFGEHGLSDGSLRQIARESGFSSAAIYLFFDNKQHLLAETLNRRGSELVAVLRGVNDQDLTPLGKLHRIVDDTVAFFEERAAFLRMLRHINGDGSMIGPVLAGYADSVNDPFTEAMTLIAGIVADGQHASEIREGDSYAIAHLYSVLINEHVFLRAAGDRRLRPHEFRGLIDGALSRPNHSARRM